MTDLEPPTAERSSMGIAIALGMPALRVEVLRAASELGTFRVSELMTYIGCTRNGLTPHLTVLENLGVLTSRTMRVPGSDRPTRVYSADADRTEEVAWQVYDAVVGPGSRLSA